MNGKFLGNNGFKEADGGSMLKWKGPNIGSRKEDGKSFSMTEFLQQKGKKAEDGGVLGPGGGLGMGCGVGLGLGVIGGAGLGGSAVNTVFGIGMGCGIGIGFGYGFGYGIGISFDSVRSRFFKSEAKKSNLF